MFNCRKIRFRADFATVNQKDELAGHRRQVRQNILTMQQVEAASSGDKMAFAMLLSYAWQNDFCFPGQQRLAEDLGLSDRSVRTNLKALEANGLLHIKRRGQGKTNIYELDLKPPGFVRQDRKKTSGLDRKAASAPERKRTSGTL